MVPQKKSLFLHNAGSSIADKPPQSVRPVAAVSAPAQSQAVSIPAAKVSAEPVIPAKEVLAAVSKALAEMPAAPIASVAQPIQSAIHPSTEKEMLPAPAAASVAASALPPARSASYPPRNKIPEGPTLVSQIKDRLPLVDYISSRVPLKSAGGSEMVGCCPFHEEKTPSFHVSKTKHVFNCKGCSASGNVIQFHSMFYDVDYNTAKMALAKELGLLNEQPVNDSMTLLAATANRYRDGLQRSAPAQDYLAKRGLDNETMQKFGVGYCFGDEFSQAGADARAAARKAGILHETPKGAIMNLMNKRIVFPIKNKDGRVIGFGGRKLDDGNDEWPKYLNTGETEYFKKSDVLYGLSEARDGIAREHFAVIVEGYMDVAMLHQHGITNAAGVMGAQASEKAFESLWKSTNSVVFCLDGDKAGRAGTMRSIMASAKHMKDGDRIGIVELPEGVDPDEFVLKHGAEPFRRKCREAISLSQYLCKESLEKASALNTAEDRVRYLVTMKEVAAMFENAPMLTQAIEEEARSIVSARVAEAALKHFDIGISMAELSAALEWTRENLGFGKVMQDPTASPHRSARV